MSFEATSVVIACHNVEKTLARCLESILKNVPNEIIAVNDGSKDKTKKILDQYKKWYKNIKVIHLEKQTGVANAEKTGIENAIGNIIFLTNADCYVPSDWIKKIMRHYQNPEVIAVGGPRIDINNDVTEALTLNAGNSSFRKKIMRKIGNIETNVIAGEDTEFFMRMKHNGYKVIEDRSIVVLHDHNKPFKKKLKEAFKYGKRGGQIARNYEHGKYISKYFLIPIFWFPFKEVPETAKKLCIRIINNIGKFWGYVKK